MDKFRCQFFFLSWVRRAQGLKSSLQGFFFLMWGFNEFEK
jgi:hypothetical protein